MQYVVEQRMRIVPTDDQVLCHNNTGHKPGKFIQNGWAFTARLDGRCGVFVVDKPFKRR